MGERSYTMGMDHLWNDCGSMEDSKGINNLMNEVYNHTQGIGTNVIKSKKSSKQEIKQEKVVKSTKFKCTTCSQVFDSKIALSIHTGRIHKSESKDKNYQCKQCNKAFFNSSYLAQHMRIHTGQKPYACPDCDKRFTQLSHLQQHKRTHTGEKPYSCPHPGCAKAFSQLSNLQSHSRSHLPDANIHKCTSCYKCFFDEAALAGHMMTHMDSKRSRNYRCEICRKSYTQDTYLQNHIKTKHAGTSNSATARNPTSIQAATSMVCKLEDKVRQNRQSCAQPPLRMPPAAHMGHVMTTPLPSMHERTTSYSNDSATSYESHQGGYMLPEQTSSMYGAERDYSSKADQDLTPSSETPNKNSSNDDDYYQQQEGYYWRNLRNPASYGNNNQVLPQLPPANYSAESCAQLGNGFQASWLPYLMNDFHSEKSSMYDQPSSSKSSQYEPSNDYFMGGLGTRDALYMD